jgi:hypothetical protein
MPRKPPGDDPPRLVLLPGRGRAEPPKGLNSSEQKAWRAIVDASPERYLDGAAQLLLRRVVAEIAIAERHEERLRRMAQYPDLDAEIIIAKAHRDTARAITLGLTALRCTPQARQASRDAGRQHDRSPSGRRPWDPIDIDAQPVASIVATAPTVGDEDSDGDGAA